MATFTSDQAAAGYPVVAPKGGSSHTIIGTIAVTANPVAADVYKMVKIPANATIIGGKVTATDMDTNATETLDMDVGWFANGNEIADPDGFGNLGVWVGDAVAGVKPEAGVEFSLAGVLVSAGPKKFYAETTIGFTCVATCATFTAGRINLEVTYQVE